MIKQYDKYEPHCHYYLGDQYVYPCDAHDWLPCPVCFLAPKVWIFDNGNHTGCGCRIDRYDHRDISNDGILSYVRANNGSLVGYDRKGHMKQWNEWVLSVPKQPEPWWAR